MGIYHSSISKMVVKPAFVMTVPLVFMVISLNYMDDLNGLYAVHGAAWSAASFSIMWFNKRRYEVPAWVFRQNNIFCFFALLT